MSCNHDAVAPETPGMMSGDARLPERVRRAQEQAQRSAFAQALADALRRRAESETPIETTVSEEESNVSSPE